MAGVVIYRGTQPATVDLPGEGRKEVKPGLAYGMSLANAGRLIASNPHMWEAGNEETEVYVPPPPAKAVPAVAAAKAVSIGAVYTPRIVNTNFTLDGTKTKWPITHGLGTYNVTTSVQTHENGQAKEVTTFAKIVAISAEAIEITLASAGSNGTTYWVQIQG